MTNAVAADANDNENEPVEIYGDSSHRTAELVETIEETGAEANVQVQPPSGANNKLGRWAPVT
ncbi:MAG: hypothetical protein JRI68_08340 [Deltaproteobacteria bacterium]|nr:hypothetical protein [Deltaproteobacteria bacterium]